ncbi:DUF4124 domain-containing protein [Granulosicoccaceae sp. 1_MG-2023]|nr:DUF4124 domain-containing protein [Granulosicoccaceae sp. 1_MG-2023]
MNTVRTRSILNRALLLAALSFAAGSQAATLYQWTDADGVLTYSPTPPPDATGLNVKKIDTAKKRNNTITASAIRTPGTATPAPREHSDAQQGLIVSPSLETPAEPTRRNNSAPDDTAVNTPEPVKDAHFNARCQDLANRITALESRISIVNDAQSLNKTMLMLSRYQKSYDANCAARQR